jgi:hypothetical protein
VDPEAVERMAKPWRTALFAATDPKRRAAAWDEVRAALLGEDPIARLAALHTVRFTAQVELDRSGLTEVLMRHIDSEDAQRRAWAWLAFIAVDARSESSELDLDKLRSHVETCPREYLGVLLASYLQCAGGVAEGQDAKLVLALMEDEEKLPEAVRALSAVTRADGVLLDRVLEYAGSTPGAMRHVCRLVLPRLADERGVVRDFLLREAEMGNRAALEALRHRGVRSVEDSASVGERLRGVFGATSDVGLRRELVSTIGQVADFASREWLERLAQESDDPGLVLGARSALRNLERVASGQPLPPRPRPR